MPCKILTVPELRHVASANMDTLYAKVQGTPVTSIGQEQPLEVQKTTEEVSIRVSGLTFVSENAEEAFNRSSRHIIKLSDESGTDYHMYQLVGKSGDTLCFVRTSIPGFTENLIAQARAKYGD